MKLFNLIALGAVASYGYKYLTKKNDSGRSKLDEIKENGPEWIEKGKKMAKDAINNYGQNKNESGYTNQNY